ncbi:osmoprotectant ABC transporter substrate-binding protein [Sporomusa sphaeroides]|uniref:Glycine betaine/carnitine/choline-binding protein OpuCC n=1 Tax=Sporomusa sphaeroides DSM 2875 TaxID=1337886 RepID=A0ABM9VZF6_9FIRM|nr:osmoprotectant ABC transporter substrate-binding protein [Sporomusa sphaeroides]OLS57070.1 glycine betaine/carnitine/choline-binding protein OpuCC precursor [Sporomusa sphaeroides DSM 2875]CVK18256.1 Glycine betaine/carnitine/choline-binding protein OpuCC precursor [Sporomusa sphaeroides DSM 2875]
MRTRVLTIGLLLVLAVVFTGCGGMTGTKDTKTIKIGSQTFSEPKILAEMMKLLIEKNLGYKVEHVTNLSASTIVHQAMLNKEVDISTRYTGTEMTGPLGLEQPIFDRKQAFDFVQAEFGKRFNQTVFAPYGFENTYALTVRGDVAQKYGLTKVSDLAPYAANMKLGTDTSFLDREADGYQALTKLYGFTFGKTYPMEIGLVYKAVKDEEVDTVIAYSTDARIRSFDLKVLADDKNFFPPYEAVIIARNDTLEQFAGVKEELAKLSGIIDTDTMTELNYLVDEKKMAPEKVALDFLTKKGLIK